MPLVLRIVAPLIVASAALAQVPPKIEEPAVLNDVYRVDPATGSLAPLEYVTSVKTGLGRSYRMCLPGLESGVVFYQGDRLVFALRGIGRSTLEEERAKPHAVLERLVPKKDEGGLAGFLNPEGRYATKVYVPLDIATYGEPMDVLDRAGKTRRSLVFLYTPRVALPPGEYAFSPGGLLDGSGYSSRASAFRIVKGAPAAQQQAAAPVQAPPRPQPRKYVIDIEEVRRSAEQGYASAQFELGSAYASGDGVLQDYAEAHKWLNIAAARLDGEERGKAAAMRDEVASHMTPEQVAQAQKRAREWLEAFQRR